MTGATNKQQKSLWQRAIALFRPKVAEPAVAEEPEDELCHSGSVHIAYRGVADDRMYIAYSRHWNEVKFFRPVGLRVFCADCRRRLL